MVFVWCSCDQDRSMLTTERGPPSDLSPVKRSAPNQPATVSAGKQKEKDQAPLFEEDDFCCPICQDLLVATRSLVPCGHAFCGHCILEYLKVPTNVSVSPFPSLIFRLTDSSGKLTLRGVVGLVALSERVSDVSKAGRSGSEDDPVVLPRRVGGEVLQAQSERAGDEGIGGEEGVSALLLPCLDLKTLH